jgi:hypothetical protein
MPTAGQMPEFRLMNPNQPPASAAAPLEPSQSAESLVSAASDSAMNEDLALSLLKQPDLPPQALEALSKNPSVIKLRKVRRALVGHSRTPRHVSLPMLRHLYTFDLMQVALTPLVAADIKRAAEEALVARLATLSSGEKLSLARRASRSVAEELLFETEPRVIDAALENPCLSESSIARALLRPNASRHLIEAVSQHAKWSLRREIRVALLGNEKTPLDKALEFARSLPPALVWEIVESSRLPASARTYLLEALPEAAH